MVHFLSIVADIQGCPRWPFITIRLAQAIFLVKPFVRSYYKRFAGLDWSGLRFITIRLARA